MGAIEKGIRLVEEGFQKVKEGFQAASDFVSPTPTLNQSVQQVKDGICDIFQIVRRSAIGGRIYSVIRSGPIHESLKKIDGFAKEHKELIFCVLTAFAAFQNILATFVGFGLGVTMGTLGAKMGLAREPILLVSTRQGLATYNYLSVASMLLLAPWLNSVQQGLVAGNYLTSGTKKPLPLFLMNKLGML